MVDTNGSGETLAAALARLNLGRVRDDGSLLLDLVEQLPGVRCFLLEGLPQTGVKLESKISLRRNLHEILCAIQIPDLEIEALYRSTSWSGLWELVDTDLQAGTVDWQPDWKGRQRDKQKLDSALRDLR